MDIPEEFAIKRPKVTEAPADDTPPLDFKLRLHGYPEKAPPPRTGPGIAEVTAWQTKQTPENAAVMLRSIQPTLERSIRKYVPTHADSPLMRSHAKLLALEALKKYDSQHANVETFLMPHLQRLQRLAVQQGNVIGIPERVLLDRQALQAAALEMEDKLGRMPSTAELADSTGISIKRIAHIRQAHLPLSESQATGADADGDPLAPAVVQPPTHAAAEFVYDSLDDPKDRLILELGLGLHGQQKQSVNDIAQTLGITAGAISQRAAKMQTQIDEMEQSGFFQ